MFDIGFSELVVIGIVALLVFGPEEFPTMVRNVMAAVSKLRRMASSVRADLEHEVRKAEELKQLIAREADIAKLHETIGDSQLTIPAKAKLAADVPVQKADDPNSQETVQDVAPQDPVGPHHGPKS
jgi:sec-independent protein translocase protein TatB